MSSTRALISALFIIWLAYSGSALYWFQQQNPLPGICRAAR
jgi:hypothetical protein